MERNSTGSNGFAWSSNITAFTNAAASIWQDVKEQAVSLIDDFAQSSRDTASFVKPAAVVDPTAFLPAHRTGVQTFALPDRPQAERYDTITQDLTKQDPQNYSYDPNVELAQHYLEALGFGDQLDPDNKFKNNGKDGIFGPKTEQAVMAYQESVGLTATGEISPDMFLRMQADIYELGMTPATEKDLSSYQSLPEKAISVLGSAFDKAKDLITPDNSQGEILANFGNPLDNMYVTSDFGMRIHPVHKDLRLHKGTDYRAEEGTSVYAAQDGVVIAAKDDITGYGMNIIIDHGHGVTTRYSHLSNFDVTVGDTVKKGMEIAQSGSTGTGTAAHLDFRLDVDGRPVDAEYVFEHNKVSDIAPSPTPTVIPAPA